MKPNPVNVRSEIGRLQSVILHRPGKELLNITPGLMEELLFDELPFLEKAQIEHDEFAGVLQKNGVEVFYLEKLAAEAITNSEIKDKLINDYLSEADIRVKREEAFLRSMLNELDNQSLILKMMEGTRKDEINKYVPNTLVEMVATGYDFVAKPMPNLYFTRDPFSFIGNGVSLNNMWSQTRRRETLFGELIFNHHPMFKDSGLKFWSDRQSLPSLEGGDIVVLSDKVLAVGISQRSKAPAIQSLAENILQSDLGYETILALTIPNTHAFMHLDTVFTMVDRDLFTLHPEVDSSLQVFALSMQDGKLNVQREVSDMTAVLRKYLKIDTVHLIRECGGTIMDAVREQWSDAYNTLAIAPREVVVYDRNTLTNSELDRYGAKLHIISSGELSRGRGGPRCMSMPISRANVE